MTALLLFTFMLSASQEPAPIRVTTRMVEVTVLVRDTAGRAVTGLSREDFHLLDGGQQERIRTFAAFDSARAAQAPPGRFAQRTPGEGPRAVTVILFDQFNSRFEQQAYSRNVLSRFFREVEPRQPIAVVSLAGDLRVLQDFTTDAALLAHTLEKYRPSSPLISATFTPTTPRTPGFAKIDSMAKEYYARERARTNPRAIAGLVKYLARYSGRKNLIWVSNWFPASLAFAVRGDDVAIYPVD